MTCCFPSAEMSAIRSLTQRHPNSQLCVPHGSQDFPRKSSTKLWENKTPHNRGDRNPESLAIFQSADASKAWLRVDLCDLFICTNEAKNAFIHQRPHAQEVEIKPRQQRALRRRREI